MSRPFHLDLELPDIEKPSIVTVLAMILPGVEGIKIIESSVHALPQYTTEVAVEFDPEDEDDPEDEE